MSHGFTPDNWAEFDRLARRYSWDMAPPEARRWPHLLFRRMVDMGLIEDIVAMERCFGAKRLRVALTIAEAGELRPRSWAWWHYRLGIVSPGEPPPPLPVRRFA